jgi:hypothetical protein
MNGDGDGRLLDPILITSRGSIKKLLEFEDLVPSGAEERVLPIKSEKSGSSVETSSGVTLDGE